MKKVNIILFLLLVGIQALSFAQTSEKPMKWAQVITIAHEGSPEDAYRQAAKALIESGFGIAHSDNMLYTISTQERGFTNGKLSLSASVMDGSIRLTGNFTVSQPGLIPMDSPIFYKGMKGGVVRNAWDEMHKVADKLPGKITYAIK